MEMDQAGLSSSWLFSGKYGDEEFIADMDNLQYKESQGGDIGSGSYGTVSLAVYRDQAVAVKSYGDDVSEGSIQREILVMKLMRGEYHIVQFLGRFHNGKRRSIVMELAYNLSLKALLDATPAEELSSRLRVTIARDVCRSLACLHAKNISHDDVKGDNVLLDFGLRAKLCDFGTSSFPSDGFGDVKVGTEAFMAPEKKAAAPGSAFDRLASDVYSLGLVLRALFPCDGQLQIVDKCLLLCPGDRPSCLEVLQALDNYAVDEDDLEGFRGMRDHAFGEAERANLAFYWTDTFLEEEDDFRQCRKLFYQERYEEAYEMLTSFEESPVNDLSAEEKQRHTVEFVQCLKEMPIAIHAEDTSQVQYEIPTEFFKLILGKRLKYSSSYFPKSCYTLDQGEEAMLEL